MKPSLIGAWDHHFVEGLRDWKRGVQDFLRRRDMTEVLRDTNHDHLHCMHWARVCTNIYSFREQQPRSRV